MENYNKNLEAIKKTFQESKNWDVVFSTSVYTEDHETEEAFIDYVEEIYQTKVKDAKHLQKLTGIKKQTLEDLEGVVVGARYSKYFRSLIKALQDGAMYKDLLQIKPQGLKQGKDWESYIGDSQYTTILWAISEEFLVDGVGSLTIFPDPRRIAQEIEAPYSVLMDCYTLTK